jgi:hypothetical protein
VLKRALESAVEIIVCMEENCAWVVRVGDERVVRGFLAVFHGVCNELSIKRGAVTIEDGERLVDEAVSRCSRTCMVKARFFMRICGVYAGGNVRVGGVCDEIQTAVESMEDGVKNGRIDGAREFIGVMIAQSCVFVECDIEGEMVLKALIDLNRIVKKLALLI